MANDVLRLSLSHPPILRFNSGTHINGECLRRRGYEFPTTKTGRLYLRRSRFAITNTLEATSQKLVTQSLDTAPPLLNNSPILLDVSGMMCGGCVARVKSLLCADERVDSAVVNMLTETAAIKLKAEAMGSGSVDVVAESLACRLTDCGFAAERRVSGKGASECVSKWKEMVKKKEKRLAQSRNRVAFAWTLVALCCGSHASHVLHNLGIHIAHGPFWDFLHNTYVKGGLAAGALLGPGRELLLDGIKAFWKGAPNMNSLVGFGSVTAFIISVVSLLHPQFEWNGSFFDEPVMLLGFVLLGRSLEDKAKLSASSDMNELLSLVSSQARLVITSENDKSDSNPDNVILSDAICTDVPTDDIRIGDSLLVFPGEVIPVDGRVLAGRSIVDESTLTGESIPVYKEKGFTVSAGTINWDGPLRIEASSTGSNSTISKIIKMVGDAQGNEAPVQRLADAIAGPFVYCVIALSAATFAFWYYIGSQIFPDVLLNDIAGPEGDPLLLSLKLSVDVLVVSCPCALGLATPTAILVGTSLGARQGLLIRGGDVLERLSTIDCVAFDKTGTLTEGKPAVSAVGSFTHGELDILQIAAAVEKTATHPIAKAIVEKAKALNLTIPRTSGQITEPGFGTLAEVDGSLVAVGSLEWVNQRFQVKAEKADLMKMGQSLLHEVSSKMQSPNYSKTIVYVGLEGEGIIGAIALSDCLRQDAESTIMRLQNEDIKTILLSGDSKAAVQSIAKAVGIRSESVEAALAPEQKSAVISRLKSAGFRVAMVGDGINDAPSLALADVGIALPIDRQENAASDSASVILLANKISQVVDALDLAKATMSKVYQNLCWAVVYNAVAVPVAAGVLLPQFDIAMTPSLSGGLMALSSILVVTNSVLLQLHRPSRDI